MRSTCPICWRLTSKPGPCNACSGADAQPAEATTLIEPTDPVPHVDLALPGEGVDPARTDGVGEAVEVEPQPAEQHLPASGSTHVEVPGPEVGLAPTRAEPEEPGAWVELGELAAGQLHGGEGERVLEERPADAGAAAPVEGAHVVEPGAGIGDLLDVVGVEAAHEIIVASAEPTVNNQKKLTHGPVTLLPGMLVVNPRRPAGLTVATPLSDAYARGASIDELRAIHTASSKTPIADVLTSATQVTPQPEDLKSSGPATNVVRPSVAGGAPIRPVPPGNLRLTFKSSNVAAAELSPDGIVEVTFVNGSSYRYANFSRALMAQWSAAPSAGSWFHRMVKGASKRHPLVPRHVKAAVPAHVNPAPENAENYPAGEQPVFVDCPHTLLRSLNAGVCPVCPKQIDTALPIAVAPAGELALGSDRGEDLSGGSDAQVTSAGGPVGRDNGDGSSPGMEGAIATGFDSQPSTNVRPPLVEPTPPKASSGAAHGPEYMRKTLRTITRAEATALLTRLQARRMRARLSTFIRGAGGTGADGAWHVLESGELDWNFHHDALCDHTQLMLEEWMLAGIKKPGQVGLQLARWRDEAELDRTFDPAGADRRITQVAGMSAHWQRPTTEYVTTAADLKIYGCGGGTYTQRTNDLAINVGPISLKSRIVMVFAVAWMWLRCPEWEVFCSSGTPSNVSRDSIATRDLVTDAWYRDTFAIEWGIKDDLDRVDKWATTAGGSREARGAGTSVTGIHADALFLDDPDDAKGVWSDAERRNIMLFWKALGNRLKDPTRPLRLIVQQNLHEEDLSTRTIADGMPRLAIPVEFSPGARAKLYTAPFDWRDPRELEGESLQASRFTAKFVAAERLRLGTHGFEAQYNCNPQPIGGGLIKAAWYRFFRIEDPRDAERTDMRPRPSGCAGSGGEFGTVIEHPAFVLKRKRNAQILDSMNEGQIVAGLQLDWLTLSVDATFGSLKDSASAVGLCVFGGQAQRRLVFDDKTEPMTFTDTKKAIRALIQKWGPRRILIEKKANGASVIEDLEIMLAEGGLIGPDGKPITVVLEAIETGGDSKVARAAAMVASIEAGLWYILEGAHWAPAYIGELTSFPHAKRDDRVDCTSQLATYYREPDVVSKWKAMGKR